MFMRVIHDELNQSRGNVGSLFLDKAACLTDLLGYCGNKVPQNLTVDYH